MTAGAKLPPGLATAPLVSDWVRPTDDGFALRTGRAELGQGVQAAMLRIASWELGLPAEALSITGPDTGFAPDEGITAGSLSMTQGGAALRAATSAARVLCLAEAARRRNTSPEALSVDRGAVLENGADTGLTLPDLARGIDLGVPVTNHAAPLGQPVEPPVTARPDLHARMTGAPFIHDLTLEGMVFGQVMLPPTLTSELPEAPDLAVLAARPGVIRTVRDGRFIGLVAESAAEASAAADWFEARLNWVETAPEPGDLHERLAASPAPMSPLTAPDAPLPDRPPDIDATCQRPCVSHAPMGPSAAVALWNDDGLTVWSHTQGVFPLRRALAAALSMPETAIRVIHQNGPGCYGHNGADDVALDACLLARASPGRPVRLVWSRQTEFRTAPVGAAMSTRVRLWMAGPKIAAARVSVTSAPHSTRPGTAGAPFLRSATLLEGGAPFPRPPDLPAARGGGAARNAQPIYAAPAIVERKLVDDLPWRSSALRSLGAHLNVYAIETALDAALMAGNIDPFDGRLSNLDEPRARDVLGRLREVSADVINGTSDSRHWGIGLARYKGTGAWAAVLAEAELGDSLQVLRVRAIADMGEVVDPDGARNQIEGGVIQAVSWTLKEAVPLNGPRIGMEGWDDYPILRFSEVPEVGVDLIHRAGETPLGAAEAVAGPTAAAIGNAVQRLIGRAIHRLPLTRDRIVAALSAP